MRMTGSFGRTLREAPGEAEGTGYRLLLRGGYLRPDRGHRYVYLPLGQAALARIAARLNLAAGESLALPPGGSDLAATLRALATTDVQSYRQLPARLSAATAFMRSVSQTRGGPLNAQAAPGAATMIIGDAQSVLGAYLAQQRELPSAFELCGLPVIVAQDAVAADAGHAYAFLTQDGVDTLLICDACGYTARLEAAQFKRPEQSSEAPLPLEKIETPHTTTIAELAALLGVPESRTAKAVFLMATAGDGERLVFAVVRGDMEVSERRLQLAVGAGALRPASESEVRATGAEPGYASPIGLKKTFVVVDLLVAESRNLVAGANEQGYHFLNTNYGRDYRASLVADIAAARAGDGCPSCGASMRAASVAIVGRSARFEQGPMKETWPLYSDETGRSQPVAFGLHEVDLGAVLAAVAERHCDEQGLSLPAAVAPYAVHLVQMQGAETEAQALYDALAAAGISCLLDDRNESPGVKFMDADLIGLPLRITLGKRSLQAGGAEFKLRKSADKAIVPLEHAVATAAEMLATA